MASCLVAYFTLLITSLVQFLIDTGVVPPSAAKRKHPQTLQLQAVNHTSISTYGIRSLIAAARAGQQVRSHSHIEWTEEALSADEADSSLTLSSTPPTCLMTDASDNAVGAALQQNIGSSWQPIAFFSKKMKPAETLYSTFNRELLASQAFLSFCGRPLLPYFNRPQTPYTCPQHPF